MYIIVSMDPKLNNRRENVSLIKVNLKGLFLYSNMTSFIGYINNTVIKLTIYFNSLMRIDKQITNIIP